MVCVASSPAWPNSISGSRSTNHPFPYPRTFLENLKGHDVYLPSSQDGSSLVISVPFEGCEGTSFDYAHGDGWACLQKYWQGGLDLLYD